MQERLYGSVLEKYPVPLQNRHDELVELLQARQYEGMDEQFVQRKIELQEQEWSYGPYLIRVPRDVQDILDEARQQHNCLASYIRNYLDGISDLYFLRKQDDPDHSLVTLEVQHHVLRQAFGFANRSLTIKEQQVVTRWCNQNHITVPGSLMPLPA